MVVHEGLKLTFKSQGSFGFFRDHGLPLRIRLPGDRSGEENEAQYRMTI
jgi:hypothetical protein